jgi:hypothetical protein
LSPIAAADFFAVFRRNRRRQFVGAPDLSL